MKFFERLMPGTRLSALTKEKLLIARFRKLLENARVIMTLLEDGKEKLREEYIFDRHYVTSLVDGVIERAGMLAFDTAVLVPDGGEPVFRMYDQLKSVATDRFIKNEGANALDMAKDLPSPLPDEPELRLLACVLAWMTGPLPDHQPAMMDFVRKVFDLAIPAVRLAHDPEAVKIALSWECGNSSNHFAVVDLEAGIRTSAPAHLHDVECRPLGLMLIGAKTMAENHGHPQTRSVRRWIACTARDRLSLSGTDAGNRIDVETTLSGHVDADFIFLYAEKTGELASILPEGFHVEKTGAGEMAWSYDMPGPDLENSLARLGACLLCT